MIFAFKNLFEFKITSNFYDLKCYMIMYIYFVYVFHELGWRKSSKTFLKYALLNSLSACSENHATFTVQSWKNSP